jgi:hypothetical protein
MGLDLSIWPARVSKSAEIPTLSGKLECRESLGGVLKFYYREAA